MQITSTQRTSVEMLGIDDAEFVLRLTQSEGWKRYIGDNNFKQVQEAEKYIQDGFLKTYLVHGFGYYLVRLLNGAPIGIAGFLKKNYLVNPDFGFAYMPEYHKQGLALESCRAIMDYGVQQYGFEQLDAVTMPANVASISLLQKLDFNAAGEVDVPPSGEQGTAERVSLYRWSNTAL